MGSFSLNGLLLTLVQRLFNKRYVERLVTRVYTIQHRSDWRPLANSPFIGTCRYSSTWLD